MHTLQKLDTWLEELEINTNGNVTKMIVGNKIDLQRDRVVDRAMGLKFAKQQRAMFMETSAEANTNVASAFEELVRKILQDRILDETTDKRSDIRLNDMSPNSEGSMGSCSGLCGR